ncbi:MAG: alpha/beta fold hydrolase [Acidobacteriota bacterium]
MISLILAFAALQFEHGTADSGGVKIHYASAGKTDAPLVVMVHGFPDFWYTWRSQMESLAAAGYRAVAMDLRGYNLSDKPAGSENYDMRLLVGDVLSVIRAEGRQKAIVMGHDWGGAIAWQVALNAPQMVERLIVLNLPHPRGLSRELANNPEQQRASEYARRFQEPDSHRTLTAQSLAGWVKDEAVRKLYVDAFERSSLEAKMAFYQRNYPRPPYTASSDTRKLTMPVLLIHGLQDRALLSPALNGTWDWVEDLTLVTIPEAGHFVQQDATAKVTRSVLMFLGRDK